jgi:hypothetical protein
MAKTRKRPKPKLMAPVPGLPMDARVRYEPLVSREETDRAEVKLKRKNPFQNAYRELTKLSLRLLIRMIADKDPAVALGAAIHVLKSDTYVGLCKLSEAKTGFKSRVEQILHEVQENKLKKPEPGGKPDRLETKARRDVAKLAASLGEEREENGDGREESDQPAGVGNPEGELPGSGGSENAVSGGEGEAGRDSGDAFNLL